LIVKTHYTAVGRSHVTWVMYMGTGY